MILRLVKMIIKGFKIIVINILKMKKPTTDEVCIKDNLFKSYLETSEK